MPLISIVIPVFNKEEYLDSCIKSITEQGFDDIEIILVDDGSKEKCAVLCDTLAAADSRIKAIHRENGGPSKARNTGIKAALGDYLMFVDSDDVLINGALSGIAGEINAGRPDIVIGNIEYVSARQKKADISNDINDDTLINEAKTDAVVKYFMERGCFWPNVRWIIRRDFFISNSLYFFEEVRSQEDIEFVPRLISAASSFRIYKERFYRYIMRENSVSSNASFAKYSDLMKICGRLCEVSGQYAGIRETYMKLGAALCVKICAEKYLEFSPENRKVFREWYLNNSFAYGCLKEKKAAGLLINIFGRWAGLIIYTGLASLKGKVKGGGA